MKQRVLSLVLGVSIASLAGGCSNKLSGAVEINGESYELASCRSGAVYGFRGVELTTKGGHRVRIAATQTGEGFAAVMPPGAATGTEVGTCGPFSVEDQNSTINDVKNVEGTATLACEGGGFKLEGEIAFANCH